MLYPLKFQPVFKDYLWGGRNLTALGKQLPAEGTVAESWEISCHPNGVSVIANGELAGVSLPDAIASHGRTLVGARLSDRDLAKFPLLVKLIDAQDRLSVQVHPDDAFARVHEAGEYGKNEMWYVVAAQPGARLVAGVRPGVGPVGFAAAIAEGRCLDELQQIEVRAGDVVNIPAGMVHAIGQGLVICEIQQNSDTTYRVYDYDRLDSAGRKRPLHVDKALAVINFKPSARSPLLAGLTIQNPSQPGLIRRMLVLNRYFKVEELAVNGQADFTADGSRFLTLTVLAGQGGLVYDGQAQQKMTMPIRQGESLLIPASLGRWRLQGELKCLAGTVADLSADLRELAQAAGRTDISDAGLIAEWSGLVGFDPRP